MKTEVIEKLAALITAAFGLVAALAWNDAVRALFVGPCGVENAGLLCALSSGGPWVYAIVITILAVIATIWIGKVSDKAKVVQVRNILKRKKQEETSAKIYKQK